MRNLLKQSASTSVIRICGAALSFLLVLIISRKYGAASAAPYFFIVGLVPFLTTFVTGGHHVYAVRHQALNYSHIRNARYTLYLFLCTCMFTIIFFLLVSISQYILSNPMISSTRTYLIPLVFGQATIILSSAIYQGKGKGMIAAIIQFVIIPSLSVSILFLYKHINFESFMNFYCVINVLFGLILWLTILDLKVGAYLRSINYKYLTLIASAGIIFLLPNILGQSSNFFIIFTLGHSSSSAVSIFGVCLRVSLIVGIIYFGVSRAILPYFARYHRTKSYDEIRSLRAKLYKVLLPILIAMYVCLFLSAEIILELFGYSFRDGKIALQIMLLGQCLSVFNLINNAIMQMCNQGAKLNRVAVITSSAVLISVFPAVHWYGLNGAATIYFINYALMTILTSYYTGIFMASRITNDK